MNRREFLPSLALLSVPAKTLSDVNANTSPLYLTTLVSSLNRTIRFEMSEAQHACWTMLKAKCGIEESTGTFTAGMCHALPIAVNPRVPKDEIWIVAFDGTVMSKITKLAVPTNY